MLEKGGLASGRLVRVDIPKCSSTLHINCRQVLPTYLLLQAGHLNKYTIDDTRLGGNGSLCLKNEFILNVLVKTKDNFSCG